MVHRDSFGLKQSYGQLSSHTQWLTAGSGLLHEEMWNGEEQQELYQLWVDLTAILKMAPPKISLVSAADCVVTETPVSTVTDIPRPPSNPGASVSIRHVNLRQGSVVVPVKEEHRTVVVYVRRGSAEGVQVRRGRRRERERERERKREIRKRQSLTPRKSER